MPVMKIFITGSTGYIGYKLAMIAAAKGLAVQALVRDLHSPNLPTHPAITFYKGDITDYSSVAKAMAGCHHVLHAAALTQLWHRNRSLFDRINVDGTRHVLEAAVQHGVKKLVFTSSCAVLGPSNGKPVTEEDLRLTPFENDYELSKHRAEELVKDYAANGLQAVIVAPPRVYGPGLPTKGNPIGRLIRSTLKRKIAFMPSAKDVVGNYAFINDVVEGHFLALEKGKSGEKYILGGENISYRQLFDTMAAASGQKLTMIAVPVSVLKVWAGLVAGTCFLLRRQTHLSPQVVGRLVQNRAVSSEKAVRQLGYRITPFEEGMQVTTRHLLAGEASF